MSKYYTWIIKLRNIRDSILFCHQIYHQNSTKNSDNKLILKRIIKTSTFLFKVIFIIYAFAIMLVAIYPFVNYFVNSKRELVLPAHLPGIDSKSKLGYSILSTFHLICLWIGFLGSTGNDVGYIAILLNGFSLSELIRNEFNRINEMALKKEIYSQERLEYSIRNVIQMHQDFRTYSLKFF